MGAESHELLPAAQDFHGTSLAFFIDPGVRFNLGEGFFRPVDEQGLRGEAHSQRSGAEEVNDELLHLLRHQRVEHIYINGRGVCRVDAYPAM